MTAGSSQVRPRAERGRIFSASMVRALLAGTKTQTRRLVTRGSALVDGYPASAETWAPLTFGGAWVDPGPSPAGNAGPYLKVPRGDPAHGEVHRVYSRVQSGDRLWVRETWRTEERASDHVDGIRYAADDAFVPIQSTHEAADLWVNAHDNGDHPGWRTPIFLPRWASRLILDVTAERFERLQSITSADALAEGVSLRDGWYLGATHPIKGHPKVFPSPEQAYASLWDELNGKRAPWASNPWVIVTSFHVHTNGEG